MNTTNSVIEFVPRSFLQLLHSSPRADDRKARHEHPYEQTEPEC